MSSDSPSRPGTRLLGFALLGGAVLLVVLGLVGLRGADRYVVIDRFLGQPFALLLVATPALAASAVCLLRPLWLSLVIAISGLGVGCWFFGLGMLFTSGYDERQATRSPHGDYEAVLGNEPAFVDPIFSVRVRQTRGLLARQWTIGCDEFVNKLRWDGPDTLVLLWDDRENPIDEVGRVKVDTASGRPLSKSPLGPC
ncbi:MAG: hypothetical protein J7518_15710 [Nocardioidaceae bacterium]|nr:hypothetical protein [Nocardioidaceae bacterium]